MARVRSLFRYPGSKLQLAKWILSFMPKWADTYCEPFVGSAAVLLQKKRRAKEIEAVNDASGDLVNFLIVLREERERLISLIKQTYWAKAEWELSLQPTEDRVERARRFYVRCCMSIRPFDSSVSFRRQMKLSRGLDGNSSPMTVAARSFMRTEHLHEAAERLRGVEIEEMDALAFIGLYDYERAWFYVDPPYLFETRANSRLSHYPVDEMDEAAHGELAEVLWGIEGMAVISGYACDLYEDLYESRGWVRQDTVARINGGGQAQESVWVSPCCWEMLKIEQAERKRQEQELIEAEAAKWPLLALADQL